MIRKAGGAGSALLSRCEASLARLERSERIRAVVFIVLLVTIGVVQYRLNAHMPLIVDDYDYMFNWATGERIGNLLDVVRSQAAHYFIWGGRSVVHAFAQMFLAMDKQVFNVANTAMYLLFLLEMYVLAKPAGRRFSWTLLAAAHLVLFFLVPFFGTVFLWETGACNYLWGTALALTPLLLLKSIQEGGFFSVSQRGWLAVPVSFFAGWTNENTACGVLAVIALILLGLRLVGKRVRPCQWAALAAQALGVAVMLLAPGNYARASQFTYSNFLLELIRRAVMATAYGAVYVGGILMAIALLYAVGKGLGAKMRFGSMTLLLLAGCLTAYAMVASPVFSDRSWTGVLALVLTAMLVVLGDIEAHSRVLDAAKMIALPFLCFVIACGGYRAEAELSEYEAQWLVQVARMEEAAASGAQNVTIEDVVSHTRFGMSLDVEEDSALWPNSTLSKVFGVNVNGK